MSPTSAIRDPIFLSYLAIVAVLLIVGGCTIGLLRANSTRNLDHAWRSYRGWLLMAPLMLLVIFLGREATIAFLTGVALLGVKEFARATGLTRDVLMTFAVYLAVAAAGVCALVPDPNTSARGWYGLFMALPVYAIATFLMVPIVRDRTDGQLQAMAYAILAFIYLGWMFAHLAWLANSSHAYGYVMFLIFSVELNDVAAYCFGKLWGRHRLRGNISPNKTWEGAIGALLLSLALPWVMRFSFPHFTALECLLTGLIVGVGGQLGDLSMSVIKRDVGVKDMGNALPGHGGILDRVDSLIYVAPLFFHMVRYFDEP